MSILNLILFKFSIFIILFCYFVEIALSQGGLQKVGRLGGSFLKGRLGNAVELTKLANIESTATKIQTPKGFVKPRQLEIPPSSHPPINSSFTSQNQKTKHVAEHLNFHNNRRHFTDITKFNHPNSPISSTTFPGYQPKHGFGGINDLIESKHFGSTGIIHQQRLSQKYVEQAPKDLKELISKMSKKIMKLNDEQIENIINKIKNTKDNIEKIKDSINSTPKNSHENNKATEDLLNKVKENLEKDKKYFDNDNWRNEGRNKMNTEDFIKEIYVLIEKFNLNINEEIGNNVLGEIGFLLSDENKDLTNDEIKKIFELFKIKNSDKIENIFDKMNNEFLKNKN